MSELSSLETAVVSLLTGIESGGTPVFREVSGFTNPDRRAATAHLRRQVAPSAIVAFDGRVRSDVADSFIGLPRMSVWFTTSNLRGGDDVRNGDSTNPGGFDLLEWVTVALDGVVVATDRKLLILDEQVVSADDTHVAYEQRYLVDRVNELTPPTYGGQVLAGADSLVRVLVGDIDSDTAEFAFPGVDGVFRHHLGIRGRSIVWRGQLRASDDASLNALESIIESAVVDPTPADMVDAWSRTFPDCVVDRFVRTGARRRHPVTVAAIQTFELHFTQLHP